MKTYFKRHQDAVWQEVSLTPFETHYFIFPLVFRVTVSSGSLTPNYPRTSSHLADTPSSVPSLLFPFLSVFRDKEYRERGKKKQKKCTWSYVAWKIHARARKLGLCRILRAWHLLNSVIKIHLNASVWTIFFPSFKTRFLNCLRKFSQKKSSTPFRILLCGVLFCWKSVE